MVVLVLLSGSEAWKLADIIQKNKQLKLNFNYILFDRD